jgi:hypothetical protein
MGDDITISDGSLHPTKPTGQFDETKPWKSNRDVTRCLFASDVCQ